MKKPKSKVWFNPNTPKVQRKEIFSLIGNQIGPKVWKVFGNYVDNLIRKQVIGKEILAKATKKLQG